MKFLAISSMKDTASTLPPAMARPLLEATLAIINQHLKEGKILEYYFSPGWNRNIVISDVNSAQEMLNNINSLPIASFMNIEVYPLGDGVEALESYIEVIKMAEKMMPGGPK